MTSIANSLKPIKGQVSQRKRVAPPSASKKNSQMDFDLARSRFWRICKVKFKKDKKAFRVDEWNKEILTNIVYYLIQDERCKWDTKKGLYFFGDPGVGKTVLAECMQEFYNKMEEKDKKIRLVECVGIEDELFEANSPVILRKYYKGNLILNDLGVESRIFPHFGNRIPFMERILFNRAIHFDRGNFLTIITSNDAPDEIEDKYSTRISDRFEKMFTPVFMDGPSRRGEEEKHFRNEQIEE